MYRRRRSLPNRYGSASRFGTKFKIILTAAIVLAVISAVITGLLLGNKAEKSAYESYPRRAMTSFGGVERPAENYALLGEIKADFVNTVGADKSSFKDSVSDAESAVSFFVNDENGNLLFSSERLVSNGLASAAQTMISLDDIVGVAENAQKLSVGFFNSNALNQNEGDMCVLNSAVEIAVLFDLAESGINDIVLFGFPDDTDKLSYVTSYMSWAASGCPRTNLCVALDFEDVKGSGAARIINATEGYANAYAVDLSKVPNTELESAIEKCAYFITNYNMRVIFGESDEETKSETLAIVGSYGIGSYYFIDRTAFEKS